MIGQKPDGSWINNHLNQIFDFYTASKSLNFPTLKPGFLKVELRNHEAGRRPGEGAGDPKRDVVKKSRIGDKQ
ncbi:MAG: hypothetical protein HGA79_10025 [Anaerolineales bacterium]|nr:hypothetical protein [Anaerolineales bacterium]